jgi:hypothetical protein
VSFVRRSGAHRGFAQCRAGNVIDQLEFFFDTARIASLEQTMVDLGHDVARSLEERIAENIALRARLASVETLAMQLCKIESDHGDRLRQIEMRVGIRPKPAVPVHATSRGVAA